MRPCLSSSRRTPVWNGLLTTRPECGPRKEPALILPVGTYSFAAVSKTSGSPSASPVCGQMEFGFGRVLGGGRWRAAGRWAGAATMRRRRPAHAGWRWASGAAADVLLRAGRQPAGLASLAGPGSYGSAGEGDRHA